MMPRLLLAAPLLLLLCFQGAVCISHEAALRKDLFEHYDKTALPNIKTNATIRFTVLALDMEEETQTLALKMWISMEWDDPNLAWDEQDYPDISHLTVPDRLVWLPDFTLYTDVTMPRKMYVENQVIIYPSGKIIYVPKALISAACKMDMTYWPHDVHVCRAKFGSWVHSSEVLQFHRKDDKAEVEFELLDDDKDDGVLMSRAGWIVRKTDVSDETKYYDCCPEPYGSITILFTVERHAPAYKWTVKVPAVGLSVIGVVLFLLPPGSIQKVVIGVLLLLLDTQFMTFTADVVKHSPSHVPLIVQFVSEQFLLTLVCVLVAVVVVRLATDPHTTAPPSFLQRFSSVLAPVMCLGGYRSLVSKTSGGTYPRSIKGEELELAEEAGMVSQGASVGPMITAAQAEWLLLAAILDRCFLLIYIVCFIGKLICFSSVL